jgi:cleavage and polyadenylation specificity factor subunit 1
MDEIIPMEDDNGDELRVISASFADPYLLILREDSSVKLWKTTTTGEMEELENSDLSSSKWLSASLYRSTLVSDVYLFLLTPDGGLQVCLWCLGSFRRSTNILQIYTMSDFEKPSYLAAGLGYLPPLLTAEYAARRASPKAAITEILAADIGDATSKSPHLIVRCPFPWHSFVF